jgi:hypothetical protein
LHRPGQLRQHACVSEPFVCALDVCHSVLILSSSRRRVRCTVQFVSRSLFAIVY